MIRTLDDLKAALDSYKGQAENAQRTNPIGGRVYLRAVGEKLAIEAALKLIAEFEKFPGDNSPYMYRLEVHVAGPTGHGIMGSNTQTIYMERDTAEAAYAEAAEAAHSAELYEERLLKHT